VFPAFFERRSSALNLQASPLLIENPPMRILSQGTLQAVAAKINDESSGALIAAHSIANRQDSMIFPAPACGHFAIEIALGGFENKGERS
jgi:hypothetical protein